MRLKETEVQINESVGVFPSFRAGCPPGVMLVEASALIHGCGTVIKLLNSKGGLFNRACDAARANRRLAHTAGGTHPSF